LGARSLRDAVELERQVGERLADPVVDVARDARPLLLCAHCAQAAEPPCVVDRERRGLDETVEEAELTSPEVVRRLVLQGDEADDASTSSRSGDAGSVCATRWSEKSSAFASASLLMRSTARVRRASTSPNRRLA